MVWKRVSEDMTVSLLDILSGILGLVLSIVVFVWIQEAAPPLLRMPFQALAILLGLALYGWARVTGFIITMFQWFFVLMSLVFAYMDLQSTLWGCTLLGITWPYTVAVTALAAVIGGRIIWRRRRSREGREQRGWGWPVAYTVMGALFAWYLFMNVNVLYDQARPERGSATAVGSGTVSVYRRASVTTLYHVVVDAPGLVPDGTRIPVSREIYERTRPGDEIGVAVYPGLMGVAWARAG